MYKTRAAAENKRLRGHTRKLMEKAKGGKELP